MKQAIVLCSGGLDSVVTAHYIKKRYDSQVILFFNYGQRNVRAERKASRRCASRLQSDFLEIPLAHLKKISSSQLHSNKANVAMRKEDLKETAPESAQWYVPARNLIFLSNAISIAESMFIKSGMHSDIFVGFKNEGTDFYPDATRTFLKKIDGLSRSSTKGKFRVYAPFISKDKEDIVKIGFRLGVNLKETYSCYVGHAVHCGTCLACTLRRQGFYWSGIDDPTAYLTT